MFIFGINYYSFQIGFILKTKTYLICSFLLLIFLKIQAQENCITTYAGTGTAGFNGDNQSSTEADLNGPRDLVLDSFGNLYIVDEHNARIRKIDRQTGLISTIAGTGSAGYNGDHILATSAQLNEPRGIAIDAANHIYISEKGNHRIRKVDANTGMISTIAGTGTLGFSGDNGPAVDAALAMPHGITVDSHGNIYISDTNNHRIRKVDGQTGIITTYAGNGFANYNGEGQAVDRTINEPKAVAVDADDNLFVVEVGNHIIRKIDFLTTETQTVAGVPQSPGFNGDDIAATSAYLHSPYGIEFDSEGNYYIADRDNHSIRKVEATSGMISTIAGTGTAGYNGDGQDPTLAQLNKPHKAVVDASGFVYIEDRYNERIRKIVPMPVLDLGEDIFLCDWEDLVLDATPINLENLDTNLEFSWFLDGVELENSNNSVFEPQETGSYSVEVRTESGCIATDTIEISLGELSVDLGEDQIICEDSYELFAEVDLFYEDAEFSWEGPQGMIDENSPNIIADQTGEYIVTVSIGSCVESASVFLEFIEPPVLEMESNLEICSLENIFLDATPLQQDNQEYEYEWFLNGEILPETEAQLNLEDYGFGFYEVVVSVSGTNCVTHQIIEVSENSLEVELHADQDLNQVLNYCEDEIIPEYEIRFSVQGLENTMEGVSFVWYLNGNEMADEEDFLILKYDTPGDYSDEIRVDVFIEDCLESAELNTEILIEPFSYSCQLTEGISPGNQDGLNDKFDLNFLAERSGIEQFIVYNRYGTEVFKENGYVDSWHGQDYRGKDLPSAVYYYVIKFKTEDPVFGRIYKGWVYVNQNS